MSADFIARLIGMIVFSILGVYWGTQIGAMATANEVISTVSSRSTLSPLAWLALWLDLF